MQELNHLKKIVLLHLTFFDAFDILALHFVNASMRLDPDNPKVKHLGEPIVHSFEVPTTLLDQMIWKIVGPVAPY